MLQLVPIPAKHLKIGDKVYHTLLRKCEIIADLNYDQFYVTIDFKDDSRRDEIKYDTTVLVLIDVHSDL